MNKWTSTISVQLQRSCILEDCPLNLPRYFADNSLASKYFPTSFLWLTQKFHSCSIDYPKFTRLFACLQKINLRDWLVYATITGDFSQFPLLTSFLPKLYVKLAPTNLLLLLALSWKSIMELTGIDDLDSDKAIIFLLTISSPAFFLYCF